jgi:glutathione peroxidase-family protein
MRTPQYTALEKLAKDYGDRGLTVVGAIEAVLTR